MLINLKKSKINNDSHTDYSKNIVFSIFTILSLANICLKACYRENKLYTILLLACFVIAGAILIKIMEESLDIQVYGFGIAVIFSCAVMTGETLGAYLLVTNGLSASIPDVIVYRYAISILAMSEVMTIAVMIFYRIIMDND